MNKKLKLSLLGTLVTSVAISMAIPIVSCSNTNDIKLTASLEEPKLNEAKLNYKEELADRNTYYSQRRAYNSWMANTTLTKDNSPSFEELEDSITFKDNEGEDVDWDVAVEKLVYGPKLNFPTSKDEAIPKITINVILNKNYYVAASNILTITIDDLGNVVANPDEKLIVKQYTPAMQIISLEYQLALLKPTTYEQQKALYDSFNGRVTEANSISLENYRLLTKESLSIQTVDEIMITDLNEVIDHWIYDVKDPFPSKSGDSIPSIKITAVLKSEYSTTNLKELTLDFSNIGKVI